MALPENPRDADNLGAEVLPIEVEDDGPGIPPEASELLLQLGARLNTTSEGSGLGLAIVADLVQLYGGELELGWSRLGGLKASVRFPESAWPHAPA